MIHRAILGSLERFLGILIEHYAGNFPLWLAPEQVRVLPISEKSNDYGQKILDQIQEAGLRGSLDLGDDKIGAKIARSHADRIPYMAVVGPQEQEKGTVNVRIRQEKEGRTIDAQTFLSALQAKNLNRELHLTF